MNTKKMTDILEKLQGGDLRSIGQANEVAQAVQENPTLFEVVFRGLYDRDPVVRMRSADVIEKATKIQPEFLISQEAKNGSNRI